MTVYSKTYLTNLSLTKRTNQLILPGRSKVKVFSWFGLNLISLAFLAAVILIYVLLANELIAQRYLLESLRSNLGKTNAQLKLANIHAAGIQNLEFLNSFAKKIGLVEAKEPEFINTDSSLSLKKSFQEATAGLPLPESN